MPRLIDVYAYRKQHKKVELLILKRAPDVIYAGQWRMIGGKVEEGEKAFEAALRECREETKAEPRTFWTLPSVNQFYDSNSDRVLQIPAFAAELSLTSSVTLNHEHVDFKWIRKEDISEYIHWPEQQRLMHLLISIITDNKVLNKWIIKS